MTRRRRLLARTSRDAPEFLESRRVRRESDLNSESYAAAESEQDSEREACRRGRQWAKFDFRGWAAERNGPRAGRSPANQRANLPSVAK